MDDEQQRTGGSVAHAYGNMLARQWAPQMPRLLTGPFLTMLYALRTLASADGRLRYERDGKAITIQQIARACRSDQKDVRDYLQAAGAAGVVAVVDDGHGTGGKRGRAVMYSLVLCPSPDWERAAGLVWIAQQRKKEQREARALARKAAAAAQSSGDSVPTSLEETSGDSAPTSEGDTSGDSAPRSAEEGSGDRAPTQVGGQCPEGVGGQCPDHPGSTHELPHEMAEVVPQPQDAHGRASEKTSPQQQEKHRRCGGGCGQPVIRPDRLLCTGCERRAQKAAQPAAGPVQGAFMISVPAGSLPGPRGATQSPQGPQPPVDPFAPLRLCDCGRDYRAAAPGRCPDCLDAAARERATGTG
ncbi:hypothetical protein HHL19_36275 [Streptomyces sp. R302]|uniref:hypothetical protein n=1 Tax=unclassified Streptomyces TaxID=2593676 RepID=UPI00145E7727|nr:MULTISPECIES: hypothetical protein [unclassified Streptomyces]NML55690.1 hypothetical protein [Streptomyces sp. R301]NML83968.1 hypothetical protein [Streptomyces sp. R302]